MLDNHGNPTTDPRFGVIEPYGALRTFGEHKGFGMALICELLGGALAAGMTCRTPADGRKEILNGMFTIIFDPEKFGQGALFQEEMHHFVQWVKASPAMPGSDGVKLAGEPERVSRAKRLAEGIPVDANTWRDLLTAATKLGLDADQMTRLAGL